jgi:hypothetical protein
MPTCTFLALAQVWQANADQALRSSVAQPLGGTAVFKGLGCPAYLSAA